MIRKFIQWLSLRFPAQLIVSVDDYDSLREDLLRLSAALAELNGRLVSIDAQVKRLNDQAGYVSSKKGSFVLER